MRQLRAACGAENHAARKHFPYRETLTRVPGLLNSELKRPGKASGRLNPYGLCLNCNFIYCTSIGHEENAFEAVIEFDLLAGNSIGICVSEPIVV